MLQGSCCEQLRIVWFFVAPFVALEGPPSIQERLSLRIVLEEKTFSPSSPKAVSPSSFA
jgi:hypothetical protein